MKLKKALSHFRFLMMAVLLLSCATTRPIGDMPAHPLGIYHHQVQVDLSKGSDFELKGIFSHQKEKVSLLGLSPFGTTLLKLESVAGKDTISVYNPKLRPLKGKFKALFQVLKENLTKKHGKKDIIIVQSKELAMGPLKLRFFQYDQKGIPRFIKIEGDDFKVKITVTHYELLKNI